MGGSTRRQVLGTVLAGLVMLTGTAFAGEDAVISSTWKVQEIKYSYIGFTTAYDCDAAEDKVRAILRALGAHPSTKVHASGCAFNRPARNFFLTITVATPVPVADAKPTAADQSRQELLKRLGTKSDISSDEFPAAWKSVELSKQRDLDLQPGDCELMEGLRDRVLPHLGIKIEEQRILCVPNQLSITPPQLKVSALMPLKSADEKS